MTIEAISPQINQTHYLLPWREFGARRLRGVIALAVSFALCIWMAWTWGIHWFFWAKLALALYATVRGLYLILPSRVELIADTDGVRWREAGWVKSRWSQPLPWSGFLRFEIDSPRYYLKAHNRLAGTGEAHLLAVIRGRAPVIVIMGYPRQVIETMSQRLLEGFQQWTRITHADISPHPMEVVDVSQIPPLQRDLEDRPPGCRITMIESEDSRTFVFHRHNAEARVKIIVAAWLFFIPALIIVVQLFRLLPDRWTHLLGDAGMALIALAIVLLGIGMLFHLQPAQGGNAFWPKRL